jgi:hypothetical protein
MRILFNIPFPISTVSRKEIPNRVGESSAFGTGHFLLFESPIWQFDFMRE